MRYAKFAIVVLLALLASRAARAQTISTYTEEGLGYPVPIPLETGTAFDGFRTYDGLQLRLAELALSYLHVERHALGDSLDERPIDAYVLSDPGDVGPDGMPEGGVMFSNTLHAREWASPEIGVRFIEQLADDYGTDPLATYLLDATRIVVIPVANPDGFLQTQRTPAQFISTRDGRMRRKNMRDTDEVLETTNDFANGVDVNRNFPVGFGGGSGSPTSEVYRGTGALSEPESQAIAGAIDLFVAPEQLRVFTDIHGAIPALYVMYNDEPAIDGPTEALALRMQASFRAINGVANSYQLIEVSPGANIGANDEYHALTYGIPAYTIEYPPPRYRVGGFGPTFILPDDEIGEVSEEVIAALTLMTYYAAGPPILEEIILWEDSDVDDHADAGEIVYEARWEATTAGSGVPARNLVQAQPRVLDAATTLSMLLRFNKPMRVDDGGGAPGNLPGQLWPIQPTAGVELALDGMGATSVAAAPIGDGWLDVGAGGDPHVAGYARYAFDTWYGTATIAATPSSPLATVQVAVQDLYGHQLDARPGTPAGWARGWVGYEDELGAGDIGGTDASHAIATGVAPETDALRVR